MGINRANYSIALHMHPMLDTGDTNRNRVSSMSSVSGIKSGAKFSLQAYTDGNTDYGHLVVKSNYEYLAEFGVGNGGVFKGLSQSLGIPVNVPNTQKTRVTILFGKYINETGLYYIDATINPTVTSSKPTLSAINHIANANIIQASFVGIASNYGQPNPSNEVFYVSYIDSGSTAKIIKVTRNFSDSAIPVIADAPIYSADISQKYPEGIKYYPYENIFRAFFTNQANLGTLQWSEINPTTDTITQFSFSLGDNSQNTIKSIEKQGQYYYICCWNQGIGSTDLVYVLSYNGNTLTKVLGPVSMGGLVNNTVNLNGRIGICYGTNFKLGNAVARTDSDVSGLFFGGGMDNVNFDINGVDQYYYTYITSDSGNLVACFSDFTDRGVPVPFFSSLGNAQFFF